MEKRALTPKNVAILVLPASLHLNGYIMSVHVCMCAQLLVVIKYPCLYGYTQGV